MLALLIVLFFVGLIVVASFPRLINGAIDKSFAGYLEKRVIKHLQDDVKAKGAARSFSADKSILRIGGGMVFDMTNGLFYVGQTSDDQFSSGIYELGRLISYSTGHELIDRQQNFFLDLTVDDMERPLWRLRFGQDHRTMSELASTIDVFRHREERRFAS